ncbi:hypothetical protein GR198_17505 [Rhizobium leguminosarum]|uniref:hypothetical protein n=1 Tax=Rhizobium leguminosarum TaxID=384 RepID=UPI0004A2FDD9|nr:hypothetical protein [Rhizobium leguminosarum]NEH57542.1 hypothetical protein [Rhizobium leguminosarum]
MPSWSERTENQLFTGIEEQPGSMQAYSRDIEIRRRHYALDRDAAASQIEAANAQVLAAAATVETAKWTKISAVAVAITVIITGLSVMLQLMTLRIPGIS